MANGSYEVVIGDGTKKWVKPEEILYEVEEKHRDDLDNYFEVIMDENGVNIIPKGLKVVEIESDREDIKRIRLEFVDGRKHTTGNIHIGDVEIIDREQISTQPPPLEKESLVKKLINIVTKEDSE